MVIIHVKLWVVPFYLLCLIILVCSLKTTPNPLKTDLYGYTYHLFCPLGSFVNGKSPQKVKGKEGEKGWGVGSIDSFIVEAARVSTASLT